MVRVGIRLGIVQVLLRGATHGSNPRAIALS